MPDNPLSVSASKQPRRPTILCQLFAIDTHCADVALRYSPRSLRHGQRLKAPNPTLYFSCRVDAGGWRLCKKAQLRSLCLRGNTMIVNPGPTATPTAPQLFQMAKDVVAGARQDAGKHGGCRRGLCGLMKGTPPSLRRASQRVDDGISCCLTHLFTRVEREQQR